MLSFIKSYSHHALAVVILIAHASEIGYVVSHLTRWHILAALVVFATWIATRTKPDKEELA